MNTPKFKINYEKVKSIHLESLEKNAEITTQDLENNYNPFKIENIQKYNPIYNLFFELSEKNYNKITLNHQYHFLDMSTVTDITSNQELNKSVFIKFSPLIDPVRYMTGKYVNEDEFLRNLPTLTNTDNKILPKLMNPNNSSYTDNFFCFLASKLLHQHHFVNSIDFYGSYLGIQTRFKANITDDLEYLSSSNYFSSHNNKLFTITNMEDDEFMNFGTRNRKLKVNIDGSSSLKHNITIDFIEPASTSESAPIDSMNELVYEKSTQNVSKSTTNSSNNSETNYSVDDESDDETGTDDSESDYEYSESESSEGSDARYFENERQTYAYVNNFPIQMICLEKCDGTLDELFVEDKINLDTGAACLIQVIMALIVYQKCFHFTHNDLHTNNIMFVNTNIEYLHYRFNKKIYKVPTYGKIFKIIDFGRGIYKFNGHQFFSDSFAPHQDAATQYNCEPYMNERKPRIDPNYSFDLCRLGTSIYDFIIDSDEDIDHFDELQETIYRWCLDDNDKNILYKRNGEERYPNFKLYKMIARTVHHHTPQEQLNFPFFKQFAISSKAKVEDEIMDIDSLPVYI